VDPHPGATVNHPASPKSLSRLAVALSLVVAGSAQEPTPAPAPVPAAKVEKLADWPAPKAGERERVLALVEQFKKPAPELHTRAQGQLAELGDGATPLIMQHVSDRADAAALNQQLFAVLDGKLGPRHAALMAREAKKPKLELRRYLTLRMCKLVAPELAAHLTATRTDKDPQTAFYAALGALALKQQEALPDVLAYARRNWLEIAPLVAEVLPAARSPDCGKWVFEHIAKAPAADQMTGLRLARYLMVKDQSVILRSYLSASDNAVKREAVNAARVLHGETPLENLPVFQVIEMAELWKKKL
jgi:hypothetical protein